MGGTNRRRNAGRGVTRVDLAALLAVAGILARYCCRHGARSRQRVIVPARQAPANGDRPVKPSRRLQEIPRHEQSGHRRRSRQRLVAVPGSASPDGKAPSADIPPTRERARRPRAIAGSCESSPIWTNSRSTTNEPGVKKFTADAFTPYDVEGNTDGVGEQTFSITLSSMGEVTVKHFAAVALDEAVCPSYGGKFCRGPVDL